MADIAKLPLVLPSHEHGLRVAVERIAHAAGISLNICQEIEATVAIKQSALAGEAFAILPLAEIDHDLASGHLVKTEIVQPAVHRTLYLAWPRRRLVGSAVQRIIDLVKQETATLIEQGRWATRFLGDA